MSPIELFWTAKNEMGFHVFQHMLILFSKMCNFVHIYRLDLKKVQFHLRKLDIFCGEVRQRQYSKRLSLPLERQHLLPQAISYQTNIHLSYLGFLDTIIALELGQVVAFMRGTIPSMFKEADSCFDFRLADQGHMESSQGWPKCLC